MNAHLHTFNRFTRAWSDVGANPAHAKAVWRELIRRYAEPHRHYHTIGHIEESLEALDRVRHLANAPAVLELAAWFHDIVYDPKRTNNESQSAAFAADALKRAGAPTDTITRITALILSTAEHDEHLEDDAAILSDIDLGILGASPERFHEYEAAIRLEYDFVPLDIFLSARHRFTRNLLSRARIFHTPELSRLYELQARQNLNPAKPTVPMVPSVSPIRPDE